jgi:hypothetical protein
LLNNIFCSLYIVIVVQGTYLVYTPFHEKSDDAGTIAWQALANAGIMLAVIAVMTGDHKYLHSSSVVYKYRCTYSTFYLSLAGASFLCLKSSALLPIEYKNIVLHSFSVGFSSGILSSSSFSVFNFSVPHRMILYNN